MKKAELFLFGSAICNQCGTRCDNVELESVDDDEKVVTYTCHGSEFSVSFSLAELADPDNTGTGNMIMSALLSPFSASHNKTSRTLN